MQEFERLFIQWTVAYLKRHKKPVEVVIKNLKATNPELGAYMEEIAPTISRNQVQELSSKLQQEIIKVCNESDNPQETAQGFFKAMRLTPEQIKSIGEKIKVT